MLGGQSGVTDTNMMQVCQNFGTRFSLQLVKQISLTQPATGMSQPTTGTPNAWLASYTRPALKFSPIHWFQLDVLKSQFYNTLAC